MEKSKRRTKWLIIILSVVALLLIIGNITLALVGDKKDRTGIVQFAQHKLDIEIVGKDSIILEPEELTLGSTATRTLKITNPSNSTPCVMRLWLEFYVEGKLNTTYLNFSVNEGQFTASESGKQYYNTVLSSGGKIDSLVLTFKVNDGVSSEFEGKKYNLKLNIESIQANKEAVNGWSDDYKPEWYDKVKNSLN